MILKGKIVLQVSGREELLEMDPWTSGQSPFAPFEFPGARPGR